MLCCTMTLGVAGMGVVVGLRVDIEQENDINAMTIEKKNIRDAGDVLINTPMLLRLKKLYHRCNCSFLG